MKEKICRICIAVLAACSTVALVSTSAQAGIFVKADNTTALNAAGAWVNNAVPGASDIAQWDSTVTAANTTNSMGAGTTWNGIKILNPGANVNLLAGATLTNGASGIDLTAAMADLILSNTIFIAPGALQQWNVAPGHTLAVAAIPTKPGQPANNTGVLQIGTTGTVKLGAAAATTIADNQGNPWVTYGQNDWAALDASGTVIAASYTASTASALTASVFNDIVTDVSGGAGSAVDVPGLRFNDATFRTLNIANSSTARTLTARGVLVTANCVGGLIGGSAATSFIRPSRSTIANTAFNIIQNSPADFTISAIIGNGSSSAPTHVVKSGPGNLILSSTGNGYSGGTDINGGTITEAAGATLGGGGVTINNTGRLIVNASNTTFVASVTVNSGGTNSLKLSTAAAQQFISTVVFNSGPTRCEFNYGSGIAPSTTTAPLLASNVTANGSVALDIFNNNLTTGIYPLIKYTNALAGTGFAAFTLGFMPPHILGYLSNDTANTSIDLVVTNVNQPIHWAVASATWDINTTANWKDTLGNTTAYQQLSTPYSFIGDSVLFDDTASGSSPLTVSLNTTVSPATSAANNSTKAYTISGSGSIGGVGSFTKTGTGTLTLATANSFSGGINLNGGTVIFSAITNLGGGVINFGGGALQYSGNSDDISTRTVNFNAGGATINDGGGTITFAKPVGNAGAGGLTKTGAGTLILTGTNKYTGITVVANGTLALAANTYISNSAAIIVNGGKTLDTASSGVNLTLGNQMLAGSGTVSGTVTVPGGASISAATNGVFGTLTINGDLTFSGGTNVYDVSTTGHDLLVVNGNLTLNSGSILTISAGSLTNGVYKIIQYSGGLTGSAGNLVINGFSQAGKIATLSDTTPNEIDLVIVSQGGSVKVWQGDGGANYWDVETTANWTNTSGLVSTFVQGDRAIFDDTSANTSVDLQASVQPASVTVNGTQSYDLRTSGTGRIAGSATLTNNSTGTLMIETANNNSGQTVINAGTVQVGNGNTGDIGTGNVINDAALVFNQGDGNVHTVEQISGSGTVTQNGSSTVVLDQNNTYAGGTTINNGVLQVGSVTGAAGSLGSGPVNNNAFLAVNRSGAYALNNGISGSGTVSFTGAGTITLSGANTYQNNTYISNGVVKLGASEEIPDGNTVSGSSGWLVLDGGATSAGTFDLNGFNETVNALSGVAGTVNGLITNSSAANVTNTLTVLGVSSTTYLGNIAENTNGGKIALVLRGGSSLQLQAANSYSGGTIVGDTATLILHNGAAAGSGGIILSNGTTLNLAAAGTSKDPSIFPGNTVTIPDNATASFSSANTANGIAGNVIGSSTATLSISGSTAVSFSTSSAKQLQGLLGTFLVPSGTYVRFSSSTLANGGDGTTFDVEGNVSGKNGGTISMNGLTGAGSLNGGSSAGTVTYIIGVSNASSTFSGSINGSASGTAVTNTAVVKSGTGTLTLSGSLTYSGATTVSNGVLVLQTSLDSSSGINLVTNTSRLDISSQGLTMGNSVNQSLSGNGSVIGNLTVSSSYGCNLIPGTSGTVGALTVNGNLTLNNTTTNVMDFNANGATNDQIKVTGNLALNGTVYLRPNFIGTGSLMFGNPYTIVKYSGSLSGDASNLALDNSGYEHLNAIFSTATAGAITVTFIGSSNLVWRGDSTNAWQVGTVTNWYDGTTSNDFAQFDSVKFDNTATNFNVALVGTLTPYSVMVNSDSNYVFNGSGSGKLSGIASLTKAGTGTLTITNVGADDFSGTTTVSNGTLITKSATALSANSSLVLQSPGTLQLGGYSSSIGGLSGNGTIDNNGAASPVLTIGSQGNGVWSGTLGNSGTGGISLVVNDTNNLVIAGANKLNSATASQINNGNAAALILTNTGSITGSGEFWIGCESAVTGKVVVAGGSLVVSNWIVIGRNNTNANGTLVVNSGTVQKAGANNIVVGSLGATGNLTVNGGTVLNNGMLWVGEAPGANAVVNLNGGVIQATQVRTNYNGGAPNSSVVNFNGGTLQASAASANFLAVYSANLQNDGLILDDGGFAISVLQPLLAAGTGGLTKQGAGTVYLDGANTYTGSTLVNAGTLAGSGSIAGSVIVAATGNLGAGDAGAVGRLTLANSLTLQGSATLRVSKTGGVRTNDQVVTSTVNYGGTLIVSNITTGGTALAAGDTFRLFSAGTQNGNFANIVGSPGSGLGYTFTNGLLSVVTTVATNPTNITASVSGNTLTLSWPADHTGWTLQVQTNGLSTGLSNNWVDVPGSSGANTATITLDPSKPAIFYRLKL